MRTDVPHVTVCICTSERPRLLSRLLDALEGQRTDRAFTYSVVVADNDPAGSARVVVDSFKRTSSLDVAYAEEKRRNIALARNAALRHATGEFVAFIDDDEFPEMDWLHAMVTTCQAHGSAGVLGPVRPHFESPPPEWVVKGAFWERPEHPTGRIMSWEQSRTGNVLFRRAILADEDQPFLEQFGTGGEDKDFFMRMTQQGHVFLWCNEGVTHETVPPERWTRSYMLRRALLRGNNILRHPGQHVALLLARSVVAVPAYLVLLPFTLLMGQHVFMQVCIRFCDHAGRLLGVVGLNPVKAR